MPEYSILLKLKSEISLKKNFYLIGLVLFDLMF